MLRRLLNAIIILSIGSKLAYAQLDVANVKAQPQLPTWETYDFIKYGNIGASLYTGTINYSVPIYNYKDNDFNYTLSVDYATNGFRVNQPSGVVGLGWSLSSPGKIIRDVKGLPDEVSKFVGGGNSVAAGTLRPYRDISAESYFNDQLCHNNNTTYPCLVNSDQTEYYDALPDTYSFNFYGYSGKFRRDNPDNGPDSYVLYDLSSNSKLLKITSLDENYSIVFKDGNGYVFEFTADSYVRENIAEGVDAPLTKVIKSWCLNKITAPNGRSIKFRYSAITENNSDNTDNGISYFPTLRYNFSSYKGYQSMSSQSNTSTINVITNKIYNNKFTGVAFPNGENIYIRYVKGVPENRFATPEGDTLTARGNCQRVSEIDVKYDDKTIKKAKFAYSVETSKSGWKNNSNRYTFLNSIDISGEGVHSFEYYGMAGYPPLGSTKSDHWGYYNGYYSGIDVADFFHNLIFDNLYNESYASSFKKNPDFESALSGSLKKICYPTGGYSTIEYESHNCSKRLIRNSSTSFSPELVDVTENGEYATMNVGGIRLKQIVNSQGNGITDTVTYQYTKEDFPNLSSGILINAPRYGLEYKTTSPGVKAVKYFNLTNSLYDYNQTHIEYSHVREIRSNSGYKDFYYSNYQNYPDIFDRNKDIPYDQVVNIWPNDAGSTNPISFVIPNNEVTNILRPAISQQTKRGLLFREKAYSSDGVLISDNSYDYVFPSVKVDVVPTIVGEILMYIDYPRYNIELSNTTTRNYFTNGQVVTNTDYEYNDYGQVTLKTVTKSDGKTVKDRFYYAGDDTSTGGIVGAMKTNGFNNSLLKQERLEVQDGVETLTDGVRYNYCQLNVNQDTVLFRPEKIEKWSLSTGWKTYGEYAYDNRGLLTQVTDSVGAETSYLWSYSRQYPVLIAHGLDFAGLQTSLNSKGLTYEGLRDNPSPDLATFAKLSSMAGNLKNYHINIYRHKPTVGITDASQPNMVNTHYEYDGYRRMTDIKDNNGITVESSEYNLKSVRPLTASISIPTSCYLNEDISVSAEANGGTSDYYYYLTVRDQNGVPVYTTDSSNGQISFMPVSVGLAPSNIYLFEMIVKDLISEETCVEQKTVNIKNALLKYTDQSAPDIDLDSGSGYVTANIYTDSATTVTFGLSMMTSGTCKITVGTSQFTYTGHKQTQFTVPLTAGNNQVKIEFASSFTETTAELQMLTASNHEIGTPNILTINF